MNLVVESGKQIRGDLLIKAILRFDLTPVPSTLEVTVRADAEIKSMLSEGKTIEANGYPYQIVKSSGESGRAAQGQNPTDTVSILAVWRPCRAVIYRLERAIIKENVLLSEIYRASGALINSIANDFNVDRFYCYAGSVPSLMIAPVLQENGGVVRLSGAGLEFIRLEDLFRQSPVMTVPDNAAEDIASEFITRHEVPNYYSIAPDGTVIFGTTDKTRRTQFVLHKNQQQLVSMSKCLVRRKVKKLSYRPNLKAGDLFSIGYSGVQMAAITVAHVFEQKSQYTRVWLAQLER